MREIALDTETTGLEVEEGHRVIEIGCVELLHRRPTGEHFHAYLQPGRRIDPAAVEVRRRNLVPADAFPYTTAVGSVYDVGD